MSDKLIVNFWGMTITADGVVAIAAAVAIVTLLVIAMRPWARK